MSSFDSQRQDSLKRMMLERSLNHPTSSSSLYNYKLANYLTAPPPPLPPFSAAPNPKPPHPTFPGGFSDDLVAAVVPPVTVVLEGRSICQRISLQKHGSYQSLAKALRQMFVDTISINNSCEDEDDHNQNDSVLDLSNAVPGHLIAYEDMENDLLLVGDLNWKDFVRVAKRIRILPVKAKSRKQ